MEYNNNQKSDKNKKHDHIASQELINTLICIFKTSLMRLNSPFDTTIRL